MSDELKQFVEASQEEVVEETKGKKKRGRGKGEKKKEKKEPKPRRDNITYVSNLPSIAGVRKFIQIAKAKKAKSAERPEAVSRYEKEIEAGVARLEQLLLEANGDMKKLLEMDEEPNKVITAFIKAKENDFKTWEEANEFTVPRSALKNILIDIPQSFFDEIPMDLYDTIQERHGKNDFRLQAICRKFNFMKEVESGNIIRQGNRWINTQDIEEDPSEKVVEEEVTE